MKESQQSLEKRIKQSKNFCSAPFIAVCTRTQGKPKLCPMGLKKDYIEVNGQMKSLNEKNLFEHWNSSEMMRIRKTMLADQKVPECEACNDQTRRGLATMRDTYNRLYRDTIWNRIEQANSSDGHLSELPFLWDMGTGHACNLACRICSPTNSSRMDKELTTNRSQLERPLRVMIEDWEKKKTIFENDRDYFKDIVIKHSNAIKQLKMQGGEPTYLSSFWELLRELVINGTAKKMKLTFFTNVTQLSDEQIELLNQFESGKIYCSIDAFGEENDFLRHPSNWSDVEKNMRRLRGLEAKWSVFVVSTLSHYNCLTYQRLLYWADDLFREYLPRGLVDIHDVYIPTHLRVDLVPLSLRKVAWEGIEKNLGKLWMLNKGESKETNYARIMDLKQILLMPNMDAGKKDKLKKQAKVAILNFDKIRNQDHTRLYPNLLEMING